MTTPKKSRGKGVGLTLIKKGELEKMNRALRTAEKCIRYRLNTEMCIDYIQPPLGSETLREAQMILSRLGSAVDKARQVLGGIS